MTVSGSSSDAGQKVNHNQNERERRDRIKKSYQGLKNSIKVKENTSRVDTLRAAIAYLNDMNEKKKRIEERIREKNLLKKKLYAKIKAKGLENKISLHDMEENSDFESSENMKN